MAIRRRALLGAIGATAATALFAGRALLSPSPSRGKKIGRYIPGESLSEQEAEIVLATIDHVLLNDVDRPVLVWPLLGGVGTALHRALRCPADDTGASSVWSVGA